MFTDFLGQEVRVGDHVVYATVSGRSPVQKLARVEVIKDDSGTLKVGVREIGNGRGFWRWDSHTYVSGKVVVDPSKNRVTYPMHENIVKVEPSSVVSPP
jgi:hypothetical protein